MKQTFELDPELVAYRTVATLYTREAFRHGVFRTVLSQSSQGELGWLQDHCDNDLAFADGSRPTPDFKAAIGMLTAANEIPDTIVRSSADDIVDVFNRAGATVDRDASYLEEARRTFGERPTLVEAFIINEALRYDARRF